MEDTHSVDSTNPIRTQETSEQPPATPRVAEDIALPPPVKTKVLPFLVITDEQKPLVEQMREIVKETATRKYQTRDFYLARWLVARNWNVQAAAKMFMDSMKWRADNNVDEIHKTFHTTYAKEIESYYKYWPGMWSKCKDGWPLLIERSGCQDPLSILKNTTPEFRWAWNIWRIEEVEKLRRKKEKETGQSAGTTMLVCMQGTGWAHVSPATMENFKEAASVNKLNYPETMRKSFIVNAPSFMSMIWNMISPWLDPSTQDKTSIHGSNFLEYLLEVIDLDALPQNLGGTGKLLPPGGIYQPFGKHPEAITVEISAGRVFQKDIEIKEKTKLEWEFKTENFDIGFAVYKIESGVKKEIFKWLRLYSNSGEHEAEPGQYAIVFDNKYSWTKKKTVHYFIKF